MFRTYLYTVLILTCIVYTQSQAASVSASSTEWTAITSYLDNVTDVSGNASSEDLVGDSSNHGLFVTHNDAGNASNTDGTFGFRIRLDAAGTKTAYANSAWLGIEANGDDVIDVYIGVKKSGNSLVLGIFGPGATANNTANSSSVSGTAYATYAVDATTYSYRAVDHTTDGGTTSDLNTVTAETDFYLSVMVDFADIVSYLATNSITITDQSALRFIAATSHHATSLTRDFGGLDGATNADLLWSQSGGLTDAVTAGGVVVIPETSPLTLVAISGLVAVFYRRRSESC